MVPRNSIILEFVHPPEGEKKTHSSSAGPSIVPVCASRPNKYTGIIIKPVPAIFRALPRWSTPPVPSDITGNISGIGTIEGPLQKTTNSYCIVPPPCQDAKLLKKQFCVS